MTQAAHEPEHSRSAGEGDFAVAVLDESHRRPVVVDFWAPWCSPCLMLGPILERAVADLSGAVVLVKVNTDDNPQLAVRYGIRGIPAVKAFRDGAIIDEFTGVLPEGQVREFLGRLAPSPHIATLADARAALESGDIAVARKLVEELPGVGPERGAIDALRARIELADAAAAVAGSASAAGQPAAAEGHSAAAPDATAPDALAPTGVPEVEDQLARATIDLAAGHYEAGLERLLPLASASDDAANRAKGLMLTAFRAMDDEAAVRDWQQRLAAALY